MEFKWRMAPVQSQRLLPPLSPLPPIPSIPPHPPLLWSGPSHLTMVVSFLEIYNEKVVDLLSKDRRVKCDIQSTAGDEDVFVKGLREVEVPQCGGGLQLP